MRDIGKNIKNIRQSKGMTQDALAETLHVTRQTVSNYENGRSHPDVDMLAHIAEVFQTDVNTLIYGPPLPESKKNAYKWAVISLVLLVMVWAAYIAIIAAFPAKGYAGYIYFIRIINKETFLPLGMFLLGWALLHGLSLFTGLQQLRKPKRKLGKIIVLAVGCIAVIVPLPFNIWSGIAAIRSYIHGSVSMSFPYIPVYQQILRGIIYVIYHIPFLYSILGCLFWLFGIPDTNRSRKAK